MILGNSINSNMKETSQELIIVLPESMKDLPVRIICDEQETGLTVKVIGQPASQTREIESLHAVVYRQDRYEHLLMNEILWIEANGSYCHIHTANDRKITLSYPLKCIQEALPGGFFIRIHRSFLVNLEHVRYIIGNCVVVGKQMLKIGKEYRKEVLDRFIFLGVRNKPE